MEVINVEKILDLTQLKNAQLAFHQALEYALSLESDKSAYAFEAARGNLIQSFEFTFEISWKMMKRYINNSLGPGDEKINTHKDLYRLAGQRGLINDFYPWLGYRDARNKTSHSYNEEIAEEVYKIAKSFKKDLDDFVANIEGKV